MPCAGGMERDSQKTQTTVHDYGKKKNQTVNFPRADVIINNSLRARIEMIEITSFNHLLQNVHEAQSARSSYRPCGNFRPRFKITLITEYCIPFIFSPISFFSLILNSPSVFPPAFAVRRSPPPAKQIAVGWPWRFSTYC